MEAPTKSLHSDSMLEPDADFLKYTDAQVKLSDPDLLKRKTLFTKYTPYTVTQEFLTYFLQLLLLIARKNKLQVKESFKPTRIADPNQTLYYQIELHKDNRTEFQNADHACSEIQGKLKASVLILQQMYKGTDPRWMDLVAAMS